MMYTHSSCYFTRRGLLFAALFVSATVSVLSQPRASVEKLNIDLGVTYNGQVRKAGIIVKNTGKDVLKVLDIQTSCGCTAVKHPKNELKPGESDQLEVEFNSTGFRGKVSKTVTIQTNDPSNPAVTVTLLTDVIEELAPINNSSVIWLGSLPVGKEVEHKVGFKNVSGKVMTLKGYTSSTSSVSVKFETKAVMPADTIYVVVKVKADKADFQNEQIMIQTDSKKQSLVPMRVSFIGMKSS